MKILITGSMILLLNSLYANETLQDIKSTVKKDITNIGYNIQLTHSDAAKHMDNDGILNNQDHSTLFGTVGVRLFPNSWKIDLSYTGTIGENILFKSSTYDEFQTNLDNYNGNYPINESKKDTYWVDVYSKPLSTSFGDFGFGWTQIEQFVINEAYDSSLNAKVLNMPNSSNSGALVLDDNNKYLKYNTKTSRIFVTYNIPSTNKWYSGLGVSYGYEKSNRTKVIQRFKSIVVKPDSNSHIMTFGINKTLDEINTGFSFKTLTYGLIQSTHKYYDYDKQLNTTYTNNETQMDVEMIFMFKPKSNKQFYISGKVMLREEDDTESYYSESRLELGMLF